MSSTSSRPDREELILKLSEYRLQAMWSLRQEAAHVFEPLGITPIRALILELIRGGVTQPKDITRALGIAASGTSVLLKELEKRGLLERQAHTTDKRKRVFVLSAAGEAFYERLNEAWFRAHIERYSNLSDSQLEKLMTMTQELHEDIG